MLYQLPNGNVIYLTWEEFDSMTDQELHEMSYIEHGHESSVHIFFSQVTSIELKEEDYFEDDTPDYQQDDEENLSSRINIRDIPDMLD